MALVAGTGLMMKDAGFINISALTMVTWRRNSDRRGTELWRSLEAKLEGRKLGEPGLRSLSLRQGPGRRVFETDLSEHHLVRGTPGFYSGVFRGVPSSL